MNAVIVGVLFIIGTVTGTIAAIIGKPILDAPDYLTNISANESQIIIVTFLVFLMGVACAGIGLALYPIMKKYSTGLAIGVVGFQGGRGHIRNPGRGLHHWPAGLEPGICQSRRARRERISRPSAPSSKPETRG